MKHLALKQILWLLLLIGSARVYAENNLPAKYSKQQMQSLYNRAYNLRRSSACLPLADSLMIMAHATGNRQAEVNALNIRALYEFFQPNNQKAVDRAFNNLLDKAEAYGLSDDYYRAMSNRALYDVREARYLDAIIFANRQLRLAEQRASKMGMRNAYRLLGIIYQYRGQLAKATYFFERSLEYALDKSTSHNPFYDYLSLADCYRSMDNYEMMLQTVGHARKHARLPIMRSNAACYEAYAHFMLHQREAFLKSYNEIDQHATLDNMPSYLKLSLRIAKAIVDGRYADAQQEIPQLRSVSTPTYYAMQTAYERWGGNYQEATQHMQQLLDYHYDHNRFVFESDKKNRDEIFSDQHVEQQRQQLLNENTRIDLENAQQRLYNTQLEIKHRQNAAQLAQAHARHNKLAAERQRLTEENLKEEIEQQRIEQQNAEAQLTATRLMLSAIGIASLLALIVTSLHYLRRRRINEKLLATNKQLNDTIKQLDNARRHATESELMKTRFIQNMSHEIRTPLSAIIGFADVLTSMNKELNSQEKADITKTITDNSNMLTTLVNDILDITSLESGEFDLKIQPVSVNGLCRDAFATVAHIKPNKVEMRINTDLPDSFTIETDEYRTKQVLINMLTNAQKNTSRGFILLDCRYDHQRQCVSFTVSDTGVGVPHDKMETIFERYQKLDQDQQGSGLGLGICRIIASRLGGTINIDRNYTNGARFWFTIPVKQ